MAEHHLNVHQQVQHDDMHSSCLQQLYMCALSRQLETQLINFRQKEMTSNIFSRMVDNEVQRQQAFWQQEAEEYVDKMLIQHPVVVERRNTLTSSNNSDSDNNISEEQRMLRAAQQQRAESCRRSRINNKMKKAKMSYRLQYMTSKVTQQSHLLQNMLESAQLMEEYLQTHGVLAASLRDMREMCGITGLPPLALQQPMPSSMQAPQSSPVSSPSAVSSVSSLSSMSPLSSLSPGMRSSPPSSDNDALGNPISYIKK